MEISENSFPLYLASNACPIIYPKNKSNDFRTRLSKPIRLSGEWEVGLKNINYGSQIVDSKEHASVELIVTSHKNLSVNKIYDFEFMTRNNRWKGFDGVTPEIFEKDIDHVLKIVETLNTMNSLIVKNADRNPVFNFRTTVKNEETRVVYSCQDPAFVLKITPRMSSALGFNGVTQFEGSDEIMASRSPLGHALAEKARTREKIKRTSSSAARPVTKAIQVAATAIVEPPKIFVEITSPLAPGEEEKPALLAPDREGRSASGKIDSLQVNRAKREATPASTPSERNGPGGTKSMSHSTEKGGLSRQTQTSVESALNNQSAKPVNVVRKLNQKDYELKYMSSNIQRKIRHIELKPQGVGIGLLPDSIRPEEEVVRYIRNISKLIKIKATIQKDKIIISNTERNVAFQFSSDFMKSFIDVNTGENKLWNPFCPCIVFPQSTLALGISKLKENDQARSNWYLNAFDTSLDLTERPVVQKLNVSVNPWLYKNISEAMKHINEKVKATVTNALTVDYQAKEHDFNLSTTATGRAKLTHGKNILPKFSKNLAYLFGLPNEPFRDLTTMAIRELDDIENRRRQLYILCNVTETTSFGEHQRNILCDFLHMGGSERMTEKSFRPVTYHSLNTTSFNDIHIEIVTDDFKPISMKEIDTVLTLHFRRVN